MTLRLPGFHLWPTCPFVGQPTAIALGIFDGVHLGHQALLGNLCQRARTANLASVVLTFDPHPAKVLSPAYAPQLLEPIDARVAHMERLHVDVVVVHPFDRATASMPAEAFVRDVLHGSMQVREIYVGADFVFGHKQGGNVELLRAMGQELGFVVNPLAQVRIEGMVASSTKIREFVRRGALQGAQDLLGRPYTLYCRRLQGGYSDGPWQPFVPLAEQVPAPGLYAAWAGAEGHEAGALVHVAHLGDDDDMNVEIYAHPLRGDALLPEDTTRFTLVARLHAMPANAAAAFRAPSAADTNAAVALLKQSLPQHAPITPGRI